MVAESVTLLHACLASELAAGIDFDGNIVSFGKEVFELILFPVFEVKTVSPHQFFNGLDIFSGRHSFFQFLDGAR